MKDKAEHLIEQWKQFKQWINNCPDIPSVTIETRYGHLENQRYNKVVQSEEITKRLSLHISEFIKKANEEINYLDKELKINRDSE